MLNLSSGYWFRQTQDIISNHVISLPHPNVLIAKEAEKTIPVEVVVRRYMAKSSTHTSIYYQYVNQGRRNIYGIDFPDGLRANQELPMGTIITPTTKSEDHDEELTNDQARETVDNEFGNGTWNKVSQAALKIFDRSRVIVANRGLILVDTKYEFGIDAQGNLMLIDEINTPDSSRFWLADNYRERFEAGATPESFDKDIIRRYLADASFTGEGPVPVVDPEAINETSRVYRKAFEMITATEWRGVDPDPERIRSAVFRGLEIINS